MAPSAPPATMAASPIHQSRFHLRSLFLLLLLVFCLASAVSASLPAVHDVSLDAPPKTRWEEVARAMIQQGRDVAQEIDETIAGIVPGPVVLGLAPLVDAFLEVEAQGRVHELQGIIDVLQQAEGVRDVPDLRDLATFNLLLELDEFFPHKHEGGIFASPAVTKVHIRFFKDGKFSHERKLHFGHISHSKGELLQGLLESHKGKAGLEFFLQETQRAVQQQQQHQEGIPLHHQPTRNSSRCLQTPEQVICSKKEARINTGLWLRSVLWEVPDGETPAEGWPVVLHFQGSFFAPHLFSWSGAQWMPFGAYEQTLGIKKLLDAGYAVITPESHMNGFTFWDTNIPPFNLLWETSPDHLFMKALLKEIADPNGIFGRLNNKRKYATGISSGGYMTSRMAVSYEGEFKALVVASASYAICGGPICAVPPLPSSHPPTLFLHGFLDLTVPIYTMEMYYSMLLLANVDTKQFVDALGGHEWIPGSSDQLVGWFNQYP